jgi:hypothetical protein
MAKLKIAKTNSVSGQIVDAYTSPTLISGNHVGSVGGIHIQVGPQINANVKVGTNSATTGSILFQKGAHKFRMQDDNGNVGTCTLVNLSTPTAANTMSIGIILANTTVLNASRITNRWVYDFSGNKYRYWTKAATTNNPYHVDAAAGVTGFVQVLDAS